jgi:hypothetical protein
MCLVEETKIKIICPGHFLEWIFVLLKQEVQGDMPPLSPLSSSVVSQNSNQTIPLWSWNWICNSCYHIHQASNFSPPICFPLHAPIHVLTLGYILNDFVLAFKELFPRMYIINSQHQVSPWHYVIAEMHCRQAIALSSWRQEPCGIFHLPCCFIPFFVTPIIPLTPNSLTIFTIFTILAFAFSFYAKISNGLSAFFLPFHE